MLNVVEASAVITTSSSSMSYARYVFGYTWGWVVLYMGVAQWLTGWGVFIKRRFAWWTGLIMLVVNTIAQLLMVAAYPMRSPYPLWSLTVVALEIIGILGLIACRHQVPDAPGRRALLDEGSARNFISWDSTLAQSADAALHESDGTLAGVTRESGHKRAWRRSAQKVTRTWNEWLAADGHARAVLYRRYISALDEEERAAAEIENMG